MIVDVCLTSCGRIDLLDMTLQSFFKLNTYPINKIFITEDSGDIECFNQIKNRWGDRCEVIFNDPKLGQSKSIDLLYSLSDAPYIFHMESDWLFENKNANFIRESIDILEENKDIHQVWIRHINDHTHPIEINSHSTTTGVLYKYVTKNYLDNWSGFSWNCGLRRKVDFINIFDSNYSQYGSEWLCQQHANKFNYTAVTLVNTTMKHIGWNRHTENYKE